MRDDGSGELNMVRWECEKEGGGQGIKHGGRREEEIYVTPGPSHDMQIEANSLGGR